MTLPVVPKGMKFQIDSARLDRLVQRKGRELGEAYISDLEDKLRNELSSDMKHMLVSAFEIGHSCALSAICELLEIV